MAPSISPKDGLTTGPVPIKGPHPSYIQIAKPFIFEQKLQECMAATGITTAKEDNARLQGVAWIDNVRKALHLPVRTYNTACVYYHKFRLVHTDNEYDYRDAAAAALFNACKIEDTLKKSRDILCAAYNMKLPAAEQLSSDDYAFESHAKTIVGLERLMLEASGFDFRNRYPQKILMKLVKSCNLQKETVGIKAYQICLDLYRTFTPLKQTTQTMALACLELAARLCEVDLASITSEYGFDYDKWATSREEIMETLLDLLDLYIQHRSSTIVGADHTLDTFIAVRIPLNQEAQAQHYPRYTEMYEEPKSKEKENQKESEFKNKKNGAHSSKQKANGTSSTPSTTSPTSPSEKILPAAERGKEGTVRFMLDPERARDEKNVVKEYFRSEEVEEQSSYLMEKFERNQNTRSATMMFVRYIDEICEPCDISICTDLRSPINLVEIRSVAFPNLESSEASVEEYEASTSSYSPSPLRGVNRLRPPAPCAALCSPYSDVATNFSPPQLTAGCATTSVSQKAEAQPVTPKPFSTQAIASPLLSPKSSNIGSNLGAHEREQRQGSEPCSTDYFPKAQEPLKQDLIHSQPAHSGQNRSYDGTKNQENEWKESKRDFLRVVRRKMRHHCPSDDEENPQPSHSPSTTHGREAEKGQYLQSADLSQNRHYSHTFLPVAREPFPDYNESLSAHSQGFARGRGEVPKPGSSSFGKLPYPQQESYPFSSRGEHHNSERSWSDRPSHYNSSQYESGSAEDLRRVSVDRAGRRESYSSSGRDEHSEYRHYHPRRDFPHSVYSTHNHAQSREPGSSPYIAEPRSSQTSFTSSGSGDPRHDLYWKEYESRMRYLEHASDERSYRHHNSFDQENREIGTYHEHRGYGGHVSYDAERLWPGHSRTYDPYHTRDQQSRSSEFPRSPPDYPYTNNARTYSQSRNGFVDAAPSPYSAANDRQLHTDAGDRIAKNRSDGRYLAEYHRVREGPRSQAHNPPRAYARDYRR